MPNNPGGLLVAGVVLPRGAEEPPRDDTFPNMLGCCFFELSFSAGFGGVEKPLKPPAPAAFPPPKILAGLLPAAGAVAPPPNKDLLLSVPVVVAPPPSRGLLLPAFVVGAPPPKILLLPLALVVFKFPNKLLLLPELVVAPPVPSVLPMLPKLEAVDAFVPRGDGFEGFVFGCDPANNPPDGVEEKLWP